MTYWAVVQTQSRREPAVVQRLTRIGYQTYLPLLKTKTRIDALFPGYLFVQIESAFYPVRWTIGVVSLRMTSDQLGLEAMMSETKKLERNGYILARPNGYRRGQKLRVTNGSFAGQVGLCAGLKGADRTMVFLEMFGRTVPVDLENKDISADLVATHPIHRY